MRCAPPPAAAAAAAEAQRKPWAMRCADRRVHRRVPKEREKERRQGPRTPLQSRTLCRRSSVSSFPRNVFLSPPRRRARAQAAPVQIRAAMFLASSARALARAGPHGAGAQSAPRSCGVTGQGLGLHRRGAGASRAGRGSHRAMADCQLATDPVRSRGQSGLGTGGLGAPWQRTGGREEHML